MFLAIYSQYVVSDPFERIGPTMVFSFMLIGRLVIYYQVTATRRIPHSALLIFESFLDSSKGEAKIWWNWRGRKWLETRLNQHKTSISSNPSEIFKAKAILIPFYRPHKCAQVISDAKEILNQEKLHESNVKTKVGRKLDEILH